MKRIILFIVPILLFAACRSAGGTETQTVDIAYPQADVVTLNLTMTAGQVTVNPADSSGVHGTLTTNVDAWRAETSSSGSSISIRQGSASADVIPNAQNSWDLQLGKDAPLILMQTNTSADTVFNLGGLALAQLNATATDGSYTLRYASPHPASDGGAATLQIGNGNLDATGLINSHLSSLSVTTTGGNVQITFDGGALAQDMNVVITTRAGDVLLKIPPNVPTQVIYRTSSGTVLETDPAYMKVNDITYTLGSGTDGDTPHLSIEIRTVIGDLRLAGA
jgi:hypothetical protein